MKIFVTGTAGFIGFHLALALAKRGDSVVGLDNLNEYYDANLKISRLKFAGFECENLAAGKKIISQNFPNLAFIKGDLCDKTLLMEIFKNEKFDCIVNLAAQAGVRYSLENPEIYAQSNIIGFLNLLEIARASEIKNFVFASSSSVYGLNEKLPFRESDSANHQISLYAASKKSNEMMAHVYAHLFGIPMTGLRFFTVYGPWGRSDMALFKFVKAALNGEKIDVFNNGEMARDFTYIDDIINGMMMVIDNPARKNAAWDAKNPAPDTSSAPFRIYNIGNSKPVNLMEYIEAIEENLGKKIEKNFLPMQPGDVAATWADTSALKRDFGYTPTTDVRQGVANFIDWYKKYYA